LIGNKEVEKETKKFNTYIRRCKYCGNLYEAYLNKYGKRPKSKVCEECKKEIYKKRTESILKTKKTIKEVKNEFCRVVDFPETFI